MSRIFHFAATIKKHEDQLFGIRLFYEGMVHIYSHDKDLMEKMNYHYSNIMERGEKKILDAKKLLEQVKSGEKDIRELDDFTFVPIHGPGLDEMTERANLLVTAYDKLFPNRDRDKLLTLKEWEALRDEALKDFEGP